IGKVASINGTLTGSVGLDKLGSGTLVLGASNGFSGNVTIAAGTLQLTNAGGLGTSATAVTIAGSATLELTSIAFGRALGPANNAIILGDGIASSSGVITAPGAAQHISLSSGTSTSNVFTVGDGAND